MDKIIKDLVDNLETANRMYREGNPIMGDYEYDLLEGRLREIDPGNSWFDRGVNDDKPKEREMELPYPMMSLNKVKTYDDLMSWANKFPDATFIVMPKYDGLSVGMNETTAWTRGNGVIGQDCTQHVSSIYMKPDVDGGNVVRGEIIIDNSDWKKFKQINEGAKSPRNSATGLINGDYDIKRIEEYGLLRIMPYEVQGSNLDKEEQLKVLLNQNYERVVNRLKMTEEYLLNLFIAWKRLYPIDGLVIEVNEDKYRHEVEANGNPSYAIAYKHSSFSEVGYGVIDRIERNVNRRGYVTPVIWLKESVNLAGADIQRVSAINMRYVFDWGLFPGESVMIVRSGEVIPKVIGVGDTLIPFKENYKNMKEYEEEYERAVLQRRRVCDDDIPSDLRKCPICGEPLVELYVDDEWCEMVCENILCDGKRYSNVTKFFELCEVDGFGEKSFMQLMDCGLIERSFFEAFDITYGSLRELEGWGELNSHKFLVEMNRIRNELPLAKFLHATGWFADLGEKTLQKIIDAGLWWNRMDGSVRTAGMYEKLLGVEGVQDITARKFVDGVEIYNEHKDLIIKEYCFSFKYIKTPKNDGPLDGMVVCATGFRDQEMFGKIKSLGGVIGDGVNKHTTCLVVKDLSSTSSKMKKAEKMGIEILDINGFKEKYLM